jgi:hypothetical protein
MDANDERGLIREFKPREDQQVQKWRRKMALRKFKKFIQDHKKSVSRQLELNVLEEETDDSEIADSATVIIGSELSTSERRSLSDDFVNGIEKMSERGSTIIAIAVALE